MSYMLMKSIQKIAQGFLFWLRKKKNRLGVFFSVLGFLLGLAYFACSLDGFGLWSRIQLWTVGVRNFRQDGWTGLIQDRCTSGASVARGECVCVALIHGFGDQSLVWQKVFLTPEKAWKKLGLNASLKLLAINLPGVGGSRISSQNEPYRVRKQAEQLRGVLLPVCPYWTVVGNDLGGWIASWLALDWPEGVSRLVLLSPAGLKVDFEKQEDYLKESLAQKILHAQIEEDFLEGRFFALRKPTLIVWGKEDPVIPLSIGKYMRSFLPGALWREVSACGHFPQKECPWIVVQSMIDMLNYGAM